MFLLPNPTFIYCTKNARGLEVCFKGTRNDRIWIPLLRSITVQCCSYCILSSSYCILGSSWCILGSSYCLPGDQYTVGEAGYTVGGAEYTVGEAEYTVGGAEYTVGRAVYTVGGAEYVYSRRSNTELLWTSWAKNMKKITRVWQNTNCTGKEGWVVLWKKSTKIYLINW